MRKLVRTPQIMMIIRTKARGDKLEMNGPQTAESISLIPASSEERKPIAGFIEATQRMISH